MPLRIIVSSLNSPLHRFALFLHDIINSNIPVSEYKVVNSFKLYNKLSGLKLDDAYILLSLDVVSLFTNIPIEIAIDSVNKKWPHIEKQTKIPKDEFFFALTFVSSSTFF